MRTLCAVFEKKKRGTENSAATIDTYFLPAFFFGAAFFFTSFFAFTILPPCQFYFTTIFFKIKQISK